MPNHIHGIIFIRPGGRAAARPYGCGDSIGTKTVTLSGVIGAFKTKCASAVNQVHGTPGQSIWQRGYYEHVIRTDDDLERIRDYVISNPSHWDSDELFVANPVP